MSAIPELDRHGLRSFGLATGSTVAALFGLALPWLLEHRLPIWPWAVAGALIAVGAAAPTLLRPVYRAWMAFGLVMSRITTPLLLGVLFLFVVTPIARLRALFGHDRLSRDFAPGADSYRLPSKPSTAHDLEKPF
jgi:Saxitoxin biosynthesis operon protein SxtJ